MNTVTYEPSATAARPVVGYDIAASQQHRLPANPTEALLLGLGTMQYTMLGPMQAFSNRPILRRQFTLASTAEAPVRVPEAGTAEFAAGTDLVTGVAAMFRIAREIVFEDGMDNPFSLGLKHLIAVQGKAGVAAIAGELERQDKRPHLVAETLRILGEIEDRLTPAERLWLLTQALSDQSAIVRDGALLGLASLDDPSALPYVKAALQRERSADLRSSLEQVVEQLENC
jgi:hypothetical protein